MAWIGKIIGGTVGLFIGGPLGLVAGAAFGHMIDRSSDITQQNQDQQGSFGFFGQPGAAVFRENAQYQAQLVFFVGIFSMLAKLARSDGAVSLQERRKVQEFIERDLRLTGESREAAERIFTTALQQGGTFEEFAYQYYEQFRHDKNMLELAIDILYRVATADGSMSKTEQRLIYSALRIFRLPQSVLDAVRNRYSYNYSSTSSGTQSRTQSDPYAVLGISRNAENDEIKRTYRKLVSEYHPDKIASKGLPDEFIQFAHDKFRDIQEAYESIRKERGF